MKKKISKLEKFKKRNDHEFMDYVYKLIKHLPIFQVEPKLKNTKCEEKSLKYRKEGNEIFIRRKDNFEALCLYTRSIMAAQNNSENLSIAYANRSADIKRALESNYPKNLQEKLIRRKQKAEELRSSQKIQPYHDILPEIPNKNLLQFLRILAQI
ncbi:hypothetical protein NQ317_008420 [Molorchus minor]|uniref:Uncharacterized protein n=1 Tax=Molorchus minor TaxID=1323400 RepID=A0ABQ9JHG8_9CUCU|nr:hypothetical protein NQ317_008420 [Molorchus minor]